MSLLTPEWAKWRNEIAKACDGSYHTIEGIEADIRAGRSAPLFGEGCCFVVQVQQYAQAKACQVLWAAGDMDSILASPLHEWAKSQGCTEMLVEGNPGWARALKPHGYTIWSITLRKPLDE